MQAKSGGPSGRASAMSRAADMHRAAARAAGDGGGEAKAAADSRENSPRGGGGGGGGGSGSPLEGSPRSPTGAGAPVGISS